MPDHQETIVSFGDGGRLSGIATRPLGDGASSTGLWCLVPNSGVVPRSGVGRLHVRLARTLVRSGVSTLRFDLSGLGDSGRSPTGADFLAQARSDLAAATRWVRSSMGSRGEIWVGLCSGAYDAFHFVRDAPSVVGLVAIDLISEFRNTTHVLTHYARRLRNPRSWIRGVRNPGTKLGDLVRRLAGDVPLRAPREVVRLGIRPVVGRSELRKGLVASTRRGVDHLFVFSGGLAENYNYDGQFADVLPEVARSPRVSHVFFQEAGHTFAAWDQQVLLCDAIGRWVEERVDRWSADPVAPAGGS